MVLTHVHQKWQMDFKVRIHLKGGETVQLHTVTDSFSNAHIGAFLYRSKRNTSRVPYMDVQTTLRACFTEWGTLPDAIQTDGEPILAAAVGELPTRFTLWLAGLGIAHYKIASGKPTQNGSVERDHRTIYDYALFGQQHRCMSELQTYLHKCRHKLNKRYPSRSKRCGRKPPLIAHPELLVPLRAYQPQLEEVLFDLNKVDALLAQCRLERKVGKTGQITIGGMHETYCVGRAYARQYVHVRFEPSTRDYVAFVSNQKESLEEVKRFPARNISVNDILWRDMPERMICPQQMAFPLLWEAPCGVGERVYSL
jgi:hypothetical protein